MGRLREVRAAAVVVSGLRWCWKWQPLINHRSDAAVGFEVVVVRHLAQPHRHRKLFGAARSSQVGRRL